MASRRFFKNGNAIFDETAIDFDLLLAHAAASGHAAALTLEVAPEVSQSRKNVLKPGERDLSLRLFRARVLRKNLDDHAGAIEDGFADFFFEVSKLVRRKLDVEDDGIGL